LLKVIVVNKKHWWLLWFLLIAWPWNGPVLGQAMGHVLGDTLIIDSLAIDKNTFGIYQDSTRWESSDYQLFPLQGKVLLLRDSRNRPLKFSYRTYPFATEYALFPSSSRLSGKYKYVPRDFSSTRKQESLPSASNGIVTNGSISRGLQLGNNQNASVQSGMNLTLQGWVNSEWQLQAQLSDAQIPVQPGGYSSKLEDFDQVNIVLFNKTTRITAGDFTAQNKDGVFLRYFKRGQGMQILHKTDEAAVGVSMSLSKGRFARQSIIGIEGNQGPYRLQGAQGEAFVILIAGTEAVYIDGRKLERGQDKDYVIDYNTAMIFFTAAQPITKDKRIVVEFQYSDKQYFRPLVLTQAEKKWAGGRMYWQAFNEWDAKNQPLQLNLNDSSTFVLSQAGDQINQAFVSGVELLDPGVINGVSYVQRDSLGMSYWLANTDTAEALYRVVFSYVGMGQGDYRESGFTAFGKTYVWVAPLWDGQRWQHQGDYIDKAPLTAPKRLSMYVMGMEHTSVVNNGEWTHKIEGAMSDQDLNLFSDYDDGNNQGWAIKAEEQWKTKNWTSKGVWEYNSDFFQRVERFREVEFERNWNIQGWNLTGSFKNIQWVNEWKQDHHSLQLTLEQLTLGNDWKGQRARWKGRPIETETLNWKADGWYTQSNGLRTGQYFRAKNKVDYTPGKYRLVYQDEWEWNNQSGLGAALPYAFADYTIGVGTKDTVQKKLVVFYRNRLDRIGTILDPSIQRATQAEQMGLDMAWQVNKNWRNYAVISRRQLMVMDQERFSGDPERNWVGRLGTQWSHPQQSISMNVFYETGSGLEQRKSYIYIEVPVGQGNYVWNDYNDNGVKELNEFEVAAFGYEANYIRTSLPTDDFISVYRQKASANLQWRPRNGWFKRVSNVSTFQWENQSLVPPQWKWEEKSYLDTSVIQLSQLLRNQFVFNNNSPIWSLGVDVQQLKNKNALTLGSEWRIEDKLSSFVRWNWNSRWSVQPQYVQIEKTVQSDFLNGRNYTIDERQYKVEVLNRNPSQQWWITPYYVIKQWDAEAAPMRAWHVPLQARWNEAGRYAVTAELAYHQLWYTGDVLQSVAYDVLEGLTPGKNATWSLQYQNQAQRVQWMVQYNGRQSPGRAIVHTGMVQVRMNW
jgi:hypothetical protein